MIGIGLALDTQLYDRALSYQAGWMAVPLGLLELGLLLGAMRLLGIMAPLWQAVALFAGGWLLAQLLGHAGFPLARLGYAEEGGELGRLGGASALAAVLVLAGAGATAYAMEPPVVHLQAGVHQGPLVITRREVLVGDPGAIVRGGIVVKANDVEIENVTVVGGENGITVDSVHGTVLDGVSVSGAKLDGIHVRLANVMIKDCTVDMHGNSLGQGIDISYNMNLGMSMVEGCTVIGGMEGITTHSSMTMIMHDRVSGTEMRGISVTEMSMGSVMDSTVSGALGNRHLLQRPFDVHDRAQHRRRHPARHGVGQPDAARVRRAGELPVAGRPAREPALDEPGSDGSRHRLADPRDALSQREGTCHTSTCPKGSPESGADSHSAPRPPGRSATSPRFCFATRTP